MKLTGLLNNFVVISIFLTTFVHSFQHIVEQIPSHLEKSDYLFIIDISEQLNYLFHKNTLIGAYDVSTGSKDRYPGNRELTEGVWRLGQRLDKDLADIYGPRLIYLEKYSHDTDTFIKTNRAFHGTNEPENIGKPTSMGCVYHYNNDIINLYSFIPDKTLVVSVKSI